MEVMAQEFLNIFLEVWNKGVFGLDIGALLLSGLVFLFFYVARNIMARFVLRVLGRLARKTETTFDDEILVSLIAPFKVFITVVGVFFAIEILPLDEKAYSYAHDITRSLILVGIFMVFYGLVDPVFLKIKDFHPAISREISIWFSSISKIILVLTALASVLQIWGVEIAPVIAGLGIFGVAVALGAQDLFKNLFGGITILAEKRFKLGDWIKAGNNIEGTVDRIGFRSTTVRRFDTAPIYVPNRVLADEDLINFSSMHYRRIYWKIGLQYSTTVDQLRTVCAGIEDYIKKNDAFVDPPKASVFVNVDKFSDSWIEIMVYCFTTTTNWGEWLKIKEQFVYSVKQIVEEAGAQFAFPSQTIHIDKANTDFIETLATQTSNEGERKTPKDASSGVSSSVTDR